MKTLFALLLALPTFSAAAAAEPFPRWGLRAGGGYALGSRAPGVLYDYGERSGALPWGQGPTWDFQALYGFSRSWEIGLGLSSAPGYAKTGDSQYFDGSQRNFEERFSLQPYFVSTRFKPPIPMVKDLRLICGLGVGMHAGGTARGKSRTDYPSNSTNWDEEAEYERDYDGGLLYRGEVGLAYALSRVFSLEFGVTVMAYPVNEAEYRFKSVSRDQSGANRTYFESKTLYKDSAPAAHALVTTSYDRRVGGTGDVGSIDDYGSQVFESYQHYVGGAYQYNVFKGTYYQDKVQHLLSQTSFELALVARF